MSKRFFEIASRFSKHSTCLKTKTGAIIVKNNEILSTGCNLCAPLGLSHGESVSVCPRITVKTGTNYELCQPLHAEVMACLNIRPNRKPEELAVFASHLRPSKDEVLQAFTKEERATLAGATLCLVGHYWACDGCRLVTETLGISNIQFDKITGMATETRYQKNNMT
ncbi:MAG: hypothetical protein HZC04_00835 [Candidatus Lloydbacteria bacterium]|nr:hypothetical protein [Candidatus Lloydbacteria bacterium]